MTFGRVYHSLDGDGTVNVAIIDRTNWAVVVVGEKTHYSANILFTYNVGIT